VINKIIKIIAGESPKTTMLRALNGRDFDKVVGGQRGQQFWLQVSRGQLRVLPERPRYKSGCEIEIPARPDNLSELQYRIWVANKILIQLEELQS
jgi:hypothetical protein